MRGRSWMGLEIRLDHTFNHTWDDRLLQRARYCEGRFGWGWNLISNAHISTRESNCMRSAEYIFRKHNGIRTAVCFNPNSKMHALSCSHENSLFCPPAHAILAFVTDEHFLAQLFCNIPTMRSGTVSKHCVHSTLHKRP